MAFHQPTFAPAIRQSHTQDVRDNAPSAVSSPLHQELDQSQEWVLFPENLTTTTRTLSTGQTPTAGLSRLSDFGSLDTRSKQDNQLIPEPANGAVEDDDDLDSLDEGLHAFDEPSPTYRSGLFEPSGSILPLHDGLGTFPTSRPPFQEQLWHFENCNPRKRSNESGHHRRWSSVQRRTDALEDHDAASMEAQTRERIENWRMEQSRVLSDEVERETRRRRTSTICRRAEMTPGTAGLEQIIKDSVADNAGDESTAGPVGASSPTIEDSESFWQRLTRRFIRDLIGIDDHLLSVIFGESLPTENLDASPSETSASRSLRSDGSLSGSAGSGWEGRLLRRLSRELGILLQQLTEHPGAFSTLGTSFNPSTADYAGMPVTVPTSSRSQPKPSAPPASAAASFDFRPTLQQDPSIPAQTSTADSAHAALWGIEEEAAADTQDDDREYWEQTPDIKTVFRLLHNRFTSQRRPATTSKPPPNVATTPTADSLRRAAIIRQYHPLVSRAAATWEQRRGHARLHSLRRGRSGSSCASSIVGSARRMGLKGGSLESSSRNYWDIGGSAVGSGGGGGSPIGGGLGAWGEV